MNTKYPETPLAKAPNNEINISIFPCIFALFNSLVCLTSKVVPLIKPIFQPNPRSANDNVDIKNEFAGVNIAIIVDITKLSSKVSIEILNPLTEQLGGLGTSALA